MEDKENSNENENINSNEINEDYDYIDEDDVDMVEKGQEEILEYMFLKIKQDKEGNKITILDILKNDNIDFIEEINKKDNIALLKKFLNILTPREKNIISARYGLDGNEELTQKELAKKLNISRSYVSRLEKRATTKILREFMKNEQKSKK